MGVFDISWVKGCISRGCCNYGSLYNECVGARVNTNAVSAKSMNALAKSGLLGSRNRLANPKTHTFSRKPSTVNSPSQHMLQTPLAPQARHSWGDAPPLRSA